MRARQQERSRELRQAKSQTLLIRYDLIISPILLIALVAFFVVLHLLIIAIVAGLVILFVAFSVLAYATLLPTARTSRLTRRRPPALEEAAVVDSTISEDAPPPAAQADEEAESKSGQ
jgi:Flp pilus assembly protein TadB